LRRVVNQDFDACGYSRRESEIVRRRHGIDHDASVIATRYSLDDCPVVRHSRSSGELIPARPVVKTAINPTQVAPGHETLESFVDCCPAGYIDEISWGPDRIWCRLDTRKHRHPYIVVSGFSGEQNTGS
jgi:hypothetical protein